MEKDRHLCIRDERISRDACQNFLRKTPYSVTIEQCGVLVPIFRGLRMEGGIGIFDFAVLDIFLIGFSVLVSKDFGFSVFVFNAVCGFFLFWHLVFGFRKKY